MQMKMIYMYLHATYKFVACYLHRVVKQALREAATACPAPVTFDLKSGVRAC